MFTTAVSFASIPFTNFSVFSKMGAITELQGLVKQLTLERNSARDMYDKVAKELTTQVAEQQSLRQL